MGVKQNRACVERVRSAAVVRSRLHACVAPNPFTTKNERHKIYTFSEHYWLAKKTGECVGPRVRLVCSTRQPWLDWEWDGPRRKASQQWHCPQTFRMQNAHHHISQDNSDFAYSLRDCLAVENTNNSFRKKGLNDTPKALRGWRGRRRPHGPRASPPTWARAWFATCPISS